MASEKLSVIKLVVIGVLVIVGALYLVRVLSWLLSLAIVGAALLGAGFIGYKIAQVVLGSRKRRLRCRVSQRAAMMSSLSSRRMMSSCAR